MRIFLIVLACISLVLGIAFVVLPMGSIALVPGIVGALFAYLAFRTSTTVQKTPPKILLILAVVITTLGAAKHFLIKTEVAQDDSFEERVEESQKKAIEELESIEDELGDLPE